METYINIDILDHISDWLSSYDIISLRQTCRYMHELVDLLYTKKKAAPTKISIADPNLFMYLRPEIIGPAELSSVLKFPKTTPPRKNIKRVFI